MATYARIQDGAIAELFSTDGDITTMFHPSLVWVDVTAIQPIPQLGWVYSGGSFSEPSAPSLTWQQYQGQAKSALSESDLTLLRCFENSIAIPAAWSTYRKVLRSIGSATSGDPTQPLPTKPPYPAGT
jgi:hypothetical protein